jgi:hypothetical protein
MVQLKIFEITLFNQDAKMFCSLSKKEKTDFIKANTAQKSAATIKEFVDNLEAQKLKNCNCGCK